MSTFADTVHVDHVTILCIDFLLSFSFLNQSNYLIAVVYRSHLPPQLEEHNHCVSLERTNEI